VFHKIRLSNLTLTYSQKNTAKNIEALEELKSVYGDQNGDLFIDDPFFVKKRERSAFVKGLQKYTLETLILTKKFLEENNLRFYLTEGTLLGAVRHNGFIPWDDDVDIAMPRDDYNRLVELAKEGKIPPELNFDSLENNPNHWVLGAKMQLVRKTPYIQHKVTKLSKCNGPYVDIFPLDYWDRPAGLKFSIAAMWVKVCRRLLFINTGYSVRARKRSYLMIARFMTLFLKNTWIEKLAIKNMTKFHNGKRRYMLNLCSYYPYYKEVFPSGFFGEPEYIKFEGELMPVPCEYDCMLKTIYSRKYDSIPPVKVTNMRKHAFDLVDTNEN
jgi:phosphorylcholine metabolism protein LicD